MDRLLGVESLGAGPAPVDFTFETGLIAAIAPAAAKPSRRFLAMPALANAHDHCRPLSPTSFGGAGKPLETWLLRLAAMPSVDPYLAACAAFGRAARSGVASVMAHYTRPHGPMSLIEEAREVARAAADIGVRATLSIAMRDRNPLVYGDAAGVLGKLARSARRGRTAFLRAGAERGRAGGARRGDRRRRRKPDLRRAIRAERRAMVFGRTPARRGGRLGPHRSTRSHASARDEVSTRFRRSYLSGRLAAAFAKAGPAVAAHRFRPLRLRQAGGAGADGRGGRDDRHESELQSASCVRRRPDRRSDQGRAARCLRRRRLGAGRRRRRVARDAARPFSAWRLGLRQDDRARALSRRNHRQWPQSQWRAWKRRAEYRRARRYSRPRYGSARSRRRHAGRPHRSDLRARQSGACRAPDRRRKDDRARRRADRRRSRPRSCAIARIGPARDAGPRRFSRCVRAFGGERRVVLSQHDRLLLKVY